MTDAPFPETHRETWRETLTRMAQEHDAALAEIDALQRSEQYQHSLVEKMYTTNAALEAEITRLTAEQDTARETVWRQAIHAVRVLGNVTPTVPVVVVVRELETLRQASRREEAR